MNDDRKERQFRIDEGRSSTHMSNTDEMLKTRRYIAAAKAHIESGGKLLDIVMPNGKRLADCTGAECQEAGEWLTKIADELREK